VQFLWDRAKNANNLKKHGLSFDEASELFASDNYLEIFDLEHSELEERFIAIGPIARGLAVVVWTDRDSDEIRIISARFATKQEQRLYQSHGNESR
jgi:uncharacterized DUF497 family protein